MACFTTHVVVGITVEEPGARGAAAGGADDPAELDVSTPGYVVVNEIQLH
jgi:hypothetical protein